MREFHFLHLDWSGLPQSPTSGEMFDALERNRPKYEEALKKIKGEDPDWQARKDYVLEVMCYTIRQYPTNAQMSAEYILGNLNQYATEMLTPRLIVAEFESKEKDYQNICRIEDSRKN